MKLEIAALKGLVILPKMLLHFDINRPASIAAVETAINTNEKLFIVCQKDASLEVPENESDFEEFGCTVNIKQLMKMPGGAIRVLVEGVSRAKLINLTQTKPSLEGEVYEIPAASDIDSDEKEEALLASVKDALTSYAGINPSFSKLGLKQICAIKTLEECINQTIIRLPLTTNERQDFLNTDSQYELTLKLLDYLTAQTITGEIKAEIEAKVKQRIDKNQKEYVLREQVKVIKEELGEDEKSDIEAFRKKLNELSASEEVKEAISKEINRYDLIPSGSQEGTVSRTYIETLLELPWDKRSDDSQDIINAQKILDEDHYGMEKIKERIIEFLAVRNFTGETGGQVLCLVGPPGTGKTSIAKSVARALNKKYTRVSLGGVHDEAEIRGHRRTYIGAMPGRIARALKNAGVSNPLMLLDEIDKTGSDYKGDISAALLEVLDGEQNVKFSDHYVELPLDLSHVLFITTANTLETIPRPLLDRMEIVEVSGYSENEKFHIAKDFLIKKQLKKCALSEKQVSFTDNAIKKLIHSYTREAGVRNLERVIGRIIRKAAKDLLTGKDQVKVNETIITKYLGKEEYVFNPKNDENQVGIVRGLAWTSIGGDTLEIEVNILPGDGKLMLTGKLGDVMKESAQAGVTYIRSVADKYDIPENFFKEHDIHIHIPEGAVPKDGPSAGITMATAVLSAVTGKKVFANLAMTGEITLRGRVLPIGGLKEKLLAAKLAGITKVLVPEKNRKDIDELSKEITDGTDIVFVSTMEEVIKEALE